jgi:hypothetical protein
MLCLRVPGRANAGKVFHYAVNGGSRPVSAYNTYDILAEARELLSLADALGISNVSIARAPRSVRPQLYVSQGYVRPTPTTTFTWVTT